MGWKFIIVQTTHWEKLRELQSVRDLDVFEHSAKRSPGGEFEIQCLASDEIIEKLRGSGYIVKVVDDAEEIARSRLGGS